MLILFSAAAGTVVIATDFWPSTERLSAFSSSGRFADYITGLWLGWGARAGTCIAEGARRLVGGLAWGVAEEILESH